MHFYVRGLAEHCWIVGRFLCEISTTIPIAMGGRDVTHTQLRVTPTFHLDVQKMLLRLRDGISRPIFHHFSEGNRSRVMKEKSSPPTQEATASSSSSTFPLLPRLPACDAHIKVGLVRILRAPIVRVQKLSPVNHWGDRESRTARSAAPASRLPVRKIRPGGKG
ncbi:hypothetical protein EYF80_028789 [Liparis tanakae]|uniref:Uncharacterized protein n=1 Tax=Liparis tanakae TaxID=230148 RepID=A0A4Z2H5U1_9TELE|nr:hypothetical protein EYF80_028789 [Liparis tanakae]